MRECSSAPVIGGFGGGSVVGESIAHAADGLDPAGAEFAAQVADVDLDDVGAGVEVESPDLIMQLFAGEHLARMPEQSCSEGELARGQLDLLIIDVGVAGA